MWVSKFTQASIKTEGETQEHIVSIPIHSHIRLLPNYHTTQEITLVDPLFRIFTNQIILPQRTTVKAQR